MFITTLFTIAKLWKWPRCSTTDEWIKKSCYIYTMEYYSSIRKNDTMRFEGKWMQLKGIMLSEVSQDQKHKSLMFLSYVEDRSNDKHIHKTGMIIYKLSRRTGL
jgi:hypothetical protein